MPAITAFLRLPVPPSRRSFPSCFRASALMLALAAASAATNATASAASVYLEELTSPELRERIAAGATTVLVPVGGTEQSGPYIVLGKHNGRAHLLAGRIAERLGNAVVAPTVSYVPEGSIRPPAAHMRYAGTISIPDSAFDAMLDATARSLCQHGLRQVVLLGDHGGYQKNLERVAQHVNKAGDAACRVYAPTEYYQAASDGFAALLRKRGYSAAEIGAHAGLADVSLSLALDPAQVRSAALAHGPTPGDGVAGDPRRASAELGQLGVQQIIEATVGAIKRLPPAH
ncbi:creatininase family protein [Rugamonas brunnea]|nr:creatininase family protein [Rugamonas brunnea]